MEFQDYTEGLLESLNNLAVDQGGARVPLARGLDLVVSASRKLRREGKQMFFIGNGASASMASHIALDMWKNLNIKAMAFNDLVSLTATSNDYSYEEVFAKPLDFFSNKGDMVVCISSSGNSPNILSAARLARRKGLFIVTLSSFSPKNKLRKTGDLNFFVPADTYGRAETAHQVLLHYWVDRLLTKKAKKG